VPEFRIPLINSPVLVGLVPLYNVQTFSLSEGYKIQRIAGSKFSQAIAPSTKTITIEAVLVGKLRMLHKKALEIMALSSRLMVSALAPALKITGIPVVAGMTISLDMQISDLKFTQSTQKRDAIDVSLTLVHVPRFSLLSILGEVADLALAIGSAFIPTGPAPNPISRGPGGPAPLPPLGPPVFKHTQRRGPSGP
jgi:hypothetical protein